MAGTRKTSAPTGVKRRGRPPKSAAAPAPKPVKAAPKAKATATRKTAPAAKKPPVKAPFAAPPEPTKAQVAPDIFEPEAIAQLAAEDGVAMAMPAAPETAIAEVETADVKDMVETAAEEVVAEVEAVSETQAGMAEQIEMKGNEVMSDVIETTKKYTDEAKARFQSAFAEMSEKTKAGVEKSTKAMEELSDIAKGNVEALVESGKIATKGMESFGQDAAEYGRVTFEKASAAMKSLAAAKSPAEFFQVQSELLSSTFDSFAKETAKTSEAMLKLAGDVVQPLSTRVSLVTEKVRSIAA